MVPPAHHHFKVKREKESGLKKAKEENGENSYKRSRDIQGKATKSNFRRKGKMSVQNSIPPSDLLISSSLGKGHRRLDGKGAQ